MELVELINKETIGHKAVYSFEKHHYAMIPWHELKQFYGQPIRLLTLDYHTDTRPAFINFATRKASELNNLDSSDWKRFADQATTDICVGDTTSLEKAVTLLRYDEHIDAAVKANLLSLVFVMASHNDQGHITSNEQLELDKASGEKLPIQTDDGCVIEIPGPRRKALPPYHYSIPENKIVILENKPVHDDEDRVYKDSVIESEFLEARLKVIDEICSTSGVPKLFDEPFILDIDLDYFNTRKSINPDDAAVFHKLIQHSFAITIAKESDCVRSCQIEGEGLTSDFLEERLKLHIRTAVSA